MMIIGGALLLIIVVSALLVVLMMRKKKKEAEAQAALEAAQAEELAANPLLAEKKPLEPLKSIEDQLAEAEGNSVKKQIEDFTDKKPELVAQLLKNWLKD